MSSAVTTSHPLRLDCATRSSTEDSLVAAFGCTAKALRAFVSDPKAGPYFEKNWERLPEFERWVYQRACERLGQPRLPDEICWFHGTRVPGDTSFSEGLLPLGAWLPRLRASVLATLGDADALREVGLAFDREGGFGMHFRSKLKQPIHWGPYAILVREVADNPRAVSQHDYLGMPEIIVDLCEDVRLASGLDLLANFEQRWKPAMVKFVAPTRSTSSGEFALATALCYLRDLALKGRPSTNSVWCFDGENNPIPPERILGVEWVVRQDVSVTA